MTTPEWLESAACRGADTNLWYPRSASSRVKARLDGPRIKAQIEIAQAICRRCPVRAECLDHAVRTCEVDGIWGGVLPEDRDRIGTCVVCGEPFHARNLHQRMCGDECRRVAKNIRHARSRIAADGFNQGSYL